MAFSTQGVSGFHGGFVIARIYRASEVLVRRRTITYRKSLLKGSLLDIVVIYAAINVKPLGEGKNRRGTCFPVEMFHCKAFVDGAESHCKFAYNYC